MRRITIRILIRILFALLARVEVQGRENIPREGAAILALNHVARMDAALVYMFLDRKDATALVADSYKTRSFFRIVVGAVDGIWVNREQADLHALREALNVLRKGGLLGIAPEGTRSHTGAMIEAKTGVAYLADKANVPVIPMAIWGTENLFADFSLFRRVPIHIHIGEPFRLPSVARNERAAALERNTDEIMCRIGVMLPPAYRGVYADHPRLEELLSLAQTR